MGLLETGESVRSLELEGGSMSQDGSARASGRDIKLIYVAGRVELHREEIPLCYFRARRNYA